MIKERVIRLIEYKGIPKEDFYVKIGMTSASFRGNAKSTPLNSKAIENILSTIPDVNPEWLLTGKGSMLREDVSNFNNITNTGYIDGGVIGSGNNVYNSDTHQRKPKKPKVDNTLLDLLKEKDALLAEKDSLLVEKDKEISALKDEIIQLLKNQLTRK